MLIFSSGGIHTVVVHTEVWPSKRQLRQTALPAHAGAAPTRGTVCRNSVSDYHGHVSSASKVATSIALGSDSIQVKSSQFHFVRDPSEASYQSPSEQQFRALVKQQRNEVVHSPQGFGKAWKRWPRKKDILHNPIVFTVKAPGDIASMPFAASEPPHDDG